ncbi:antitoxin ParD1/3/4 [Rhizobium sp. NFR07]|jgi:antitoxin ParD1/3/4|uniref:type II toxin-antitoxin system ParD family antitoxin n=1 Tax=Rhizobium sp. NFR07 TaxID=1566262 RepID=UPI0008E45724|nr:type II toxin-antitoxin system ParD family antitoxin [Rhizobium sp. NFR07]SFB03690.1 antitoxin ParD1/3/4 [Rhizobium sp. NFR07]
MADSANLGKHFDDYVDELVKSGRYETRDDVLREGVRLIEVRERRLAELDAELAQGIADVEAGRVHTADEVLEFFEEKYAALNKGRNA